MENRAHALAAGLFTLVLGIALVSAAWWFTRGDDAKFVPYVVAATASVTGLKVDAPVRYRGVDIGRVAAVRLAKDKAGTIEVHIVVDPATPIDRSTYAQLGYLGVTGLAFIALNDAGKTQPGHREQIAAIPMKPSILDSGEDLLATISGIAEGVKDVFDADFKARVKRTVANVERTTEHAAILARQLEPTVKQMPGLIAAARETVQEAKSALGALQGTLASAQGAIAKADNLMTSANALALKLDSRLDALNSMSATAEDVGAAARALQLDTLPRINVAAEDLVRKTRALDRFVQTLSDQPQSLVFGASGPTPGPGEPGFGAGAK